MTKKRFLSLIFVGILSSFIFNHTFIAAPATAAPALFVSTKNDLSSRVATLEGKICSTFGVTQKEWESYKNSWTGKAYLQVALMGRFGSTVVNKFFGFCEWLNPFSNAMIVGKFGVKFKNKIASVFKRVSGAPCVAIEDCKDSIGYDVYTKESKVFLDEKVLKNLSEQEIGGLILHEIGHLVVETNFLRNCINLLAKDKAGTVDESAVKSLSCNFSHLHEEIADKLAALSGGIETAKALAARFRRLSRPACQRYSSDSTRASYLDQLASQMSSDPYYKDGKTYGSALNIRIP